MVWCKEITFSLITSSIKHITEPLAIPELFFDSGCIVLFSFAVHTIPVSQLASTLVDLL